jgi:hypothetical protein
MYFKVVAGVKEYTFKISRLTKIIQTNKNSAEVGFIEKVFVIFFCDIRNKHPYAIILSCLFISGISDIFYYYFVSAGFFEHTFFISIFNLAWN